MSRTNLIKIILYLILAVVLILFFGWKFQFKSLNFLGIFEIAPPQKELAPSVVIIEIKPIKNSPENIEFDFFITNTGGLAKNLSFYPSYMIGDTEIPIVDHSEPVYLGPKQSQNMKYGLKLNLNELDKLILEKQELLLNIKISYSDDSGKSYNTLVKTKYYLATNIIDILSAKI